MHYKPHILRRAGDAAREPQDRRVVGRPSAEDEVTRRAKEDAGRAFGKIREDLRRLAQKKRMKRGETIAAGRAETSTKVA